MSEPMYVVEWLEPPTHRPVEGDEFMPHGWCGGCETCGYGPAPSVCVKCSYDEQGHPVAPVAWPCPHHLTEDAT